MHTQTTTALSSTLLSDDLWKDTCAGRLLVRGRMLQVHVCVYSLTFVSLFCFGFLNIYLFIWLCRVLVAACVRDLAPRPGIEPGPPA